MEFARRQLEKYGWSDGKGLGRHEDGISQALRPRLKRSAAGVGHDPAADHNDHWWSTLYDTAAANVEVTGGANGKTKRITTRDPDAVVISDKSWRIRSKRPEHESKSSGYMEHFVKTAVLTSGGVRMERVASSGSSDEDESAVRTARLTDEQLLAACGGRTAHKGARHGLRAKGKLARIEEQERNLLKLSRYEGYSHVSATVTQEQSSDVETKGIAKKSKNHIEHKVAKRKNSWKDNPTDNTFDNKIHNTSKECRESNEIDDCIADEDGNHYYKKKHRKNKSTKVYPVFINGDETINDSQDICFEDLNEMEKEVGDERNKGNDNNYVTSQKVTLKSQEKDIKEKKKRKKKNVASQMAIMAEDNNLTSVECSQGNLNEGLSEDERETFEVKNSKNFRKIKNKEKHIITKEKVDFTEAPEKVKKSKKNKRKKLSTDQV